MIDLRSDTVTRPTSEMRSAIASAEVGDDVYGEDPSVLGLETYVAELLNKESALFVPSGTMANQICLALHGRAGDEILVGSGAHIALYESGAAPGLSGLQLTPLAGDGRFTADALRDALHPPEAYYYAKQCAVAIENTHNHSGGRVFPQDDVLEVAALARANALAVHLDGARLWNASVATGLSVAELAAPADTVSVCLSKGLGAPVGSVALFPKERRVDALRLRRRFGGALRQSGLLAAAGLHALRHHRDDLSHDHRRAKGLAEGLAALGYDCDVSIVDTNIVVFRVEMSAERFVQRAREAGVLLGAIGPRSIRAVTHRDLSDANIEEALDVFRVVRG
ncbi:MAG: GntG family PLP-dependent aldolase [Myxococcota bacterium]